MRCGEMDCMMMMMIQKKVSRELGGAEKQERQKEVEDRFDGKCGPAKQSCEETFLVMKRKEGGCEGKEATVDWELDIAKDGEIGIHDQ